MVLAGAFGKPAIIVDTHVLRLSRRMGLTKENDPEKVEFELRKIVPKKMWSEFSFAMMEHGKRVCKAKKPACNECKLECAKIE